MEDHCFMGRSSSFHKYLDPAASHAMEFVDVALQMQRRGTHHVYQPMAQFLFDVSVDKLVSPTCLT